MTVRGLFKYFFVAFGFAAIVMAVVLYLNTASFMKEAVSGQGVLENVHERRVDEKTVCEWVVRFRTEDGRPTEFSTRAGTRCAGARIGDAVPILYPPARPAEARVDDFFALWGGSIIGGLIGPVFLLIGGIWIAAGRRKRRRVATLMREGRRIETELERVEHVTSMKMQYRHPYRVVTRGRDPLSGDSRRFLSDYLWYDPSPYLQDVSVPVFIERDDPRRYHMDLSFLPGAPK